MDCRFQLATRQVLARSAPNVPFGDSDDFLELNNILDPPSNPTNEPSTSSTPVEPVTIEDLQGRWYDDVGLQILVEGSMVNFSDGAALRLGTTDENALTLRGTVQVRGKWHGRR